MATLVMRYLVLDYDKWVKELHSSGTKRVWNRFQVRSYQILQSFAQKREVMLIHQFDQVEKAKIMVRDLEMRSHMDRSGVDMMNVKHPEYTICTGNKGPLRVGRNRAVATVVMKLRISNIARWNSYFPLENRDPFCAGARFWASHNVTTWEVLPLVSDEQMYYVIAGISGSVKNAEAFVNDPELEPLLVAASMSGKPTYFVANSATGPLDIQTGNRRTSLGDSFFSKMPVQFSEQLSPEQLAALWERYDSNHNDNLELEEVVDLMKDLLEKMKRTLPAAILENAKSLGITVDDVKPQIRSLLRELDDAPVEEIATEMWEDMDTNKDGVVSRAEFMETFQHLLMQCMQRFTG